MGLQFPTFTPRSGSQADYATPDLPNWRSSRAILQSTLACEAGYEAGLNGLSCGFMWEPVLPGKILSCGFFRGGWIPWRQKGISFSGLTPCWPLPDRVAGTPADRPTNYHLSLQDPKDVGYAI